MGDGQSRKIGALRKFGLLNESGSVCSECLHEPECTMQTPSDIDVVIQPDIRIKHIDPLHESDPGDRCLVDVVEVVCYTFAGESNEKRKSWETKKADFIEQLESRFDVLLFEVGITAEVGGPDDPLIDHMFSAIIHFIDAMRHHVLETIDDTLYRAVQEDMAKWSYEGAELQVCCDDSVNTHTSKDVHELHASFDLRGFGSATQFRIALYPRKV